MKAVAVLTIIVFILTIAVVCLTMRVVTLSRELNVADTQVDDVRAVADVPIVLSGLTTTIDDVPVADGDRVAVRAQRNAGENGVWIVGREKWRRGVQPRSGSMFRCLDGRRNGGRMFLVFVGGGGGTAIVHIVNVAEAVLGRRSIDEEAGKVLVTAPEWPRGVRFVDREGLKTAELLPVSELTSVPPRGLAIFELGPGPHELHVWHNRVLTGKARVLGGKILRQTGDLILDMSLDDTEVTVRNTIGIDGVSAQVFSVIV